MYKQTETASNTFKLILIVKQVKNWFLNNIDLGRQAGPFQWSIIFEEFLECQLPRQLATDITCNVGLKYCSLYYFCLLFRVKKTCTFVSPKAWFSYIVIHRRCPCGLIRWSTTDKILCVSEIIFSFSDPRQ